MSKKEKSFVSLADFTTMIDLLDGEVEIYSEKVVDDVRTDGDSIDEHTISDIDRILVTNNVIKSLIEFAISNDENPNK